MACLALLGFFALDAAYEYISFAFATETAADMLFWPCWRCCWVCCCRASAFLHPATDAPTVPGRHRHRRLLAALGGFSQYVMNLEFSHQLDYSPTLKPLAFKRTASQSPEAFLQSLGEIRAAVDADATE